jgi:GTP-binding protein
VERKESVPVVALVGRPNVGKSSLFNRIVGGASAIVDSEAGTTRDRHFARAEWAGRTFWLVDTGGLPEHTSRPIDAEVRSQVLRAIDEADLLLLVVDASDGVTPEDARVVDLLRNSARPWLLVANKVDDPASTSYLEFFELGAGEPLPVSALNGKNSGDLLDAVVAHIPAGPGIEEDALYVAVVGRPNVGKSSFVNRLLGETRLVVSDEGGTTRDAIDTPMQYHGRTIVFIDTAGLRRQARVEEDVEFYSALRSRRAIERAQASLLIVDAEQGLQNQDLKIANMAWEAGSALILVVNKWDLKEKDGKTADTFRKDAEEKAPFLKHVPFLFASAKTGLRVHAVLELLLQVETERRKRIPTARVNEVLGELVGRRQPPQAAGREVKLLYATQTESAPPSFTVFCSAPDLVQEHYVRYLHNGFRNAWSFRGNPLRINLRGRAE